MAGKSLIGPHEFFYKPVGVLLSPAMFSTVRSKMMIKLMKNHEGVSKFFPIHHMNGFGPGNIASDFFAVFLGYSNLQTWNTDTVVAAESFDGFISLLHENRLHDLGFEKMFAVKHFLFSPLHWQLKDIR